MLKSAKKYVMVMLGTICLLLGVIGVFLPVLPTTPFLLLASFFYVRSSKRLYRWLIRQKTIGAYLYNYVTYRAVRRSTKVFSLIFLWGSLIVSAVLIENWHVKALLMIVGIGVSIHLLTLKTMEKAEFGQLCLNDETEIVCSDPDVQC